MDDLIVYALPVFGLLMAAEFGYGLFVRRNTYAFADTLSSLSQGLLSQLVAVCTQVIQVGLYAMAYPFIALAPHAALWQHWPGVLLAVLLYDFCDYWLHRVSHQSAIFWAAHVVHHQSQHFNLSTALRQESAYGLSGWMFFLPLAVAGIPPNVFAIAGIVVLFYQFWIHTEHVGKLGPLDRIFSTPSNHRVHHATNERYIDHNFGAILVIWDRLFGTFEPESEACVYGTRVPLASWDPVRAVGGTYAALLFKARAATGWRDKLGVLLRSPSWEPPGITASAALGRAEAVDATPRYDPPASNAQRAVAAALFVAMTACTAVFLWRAEALGRLAIAGTAAVVVGGLWCVGAVLERRLTPRAAAGLGTLAVACAAALLGFA